MDAKHFQAIKAKLHSLHEVPAGSWHTLYREDVGMLVEALEKAWDDLERTKEGYRG